MTVLFMGMDEFTSAATGQLYRDGRQIIVLRLKPLARVAGQLEPDEESLHDYQGNNSKSRCQIHKAGQAEITWIVPNILLRL